MRTTTKLVLLSALAVPQLAVADEKMEIGAFIGAHFWNDNNELGDAPGLRPDDLDDALIFGVRISRRVVDYVSAEGELAISPAQSMDRNIDVVALGYRLHAMVHPSKLLRGRFQPFALVGLGGVTAASSDTGVFANDTDFVWHGGLGLKYKVGEEWGLRLDARLLLPPALEGLVTTDGEILLGVYKTFGAKRKVEPPPPPPPADTDGDGIVDTADKCPNEAEDKDGIADDDGCVDVEPPPPDTDGDGVIDTADKCPDQPEDKDGFADDDGCPDPDNDNDGVPDAADKCSADAETANGYQDEDGCADELPAQVKQFTGAIAGIEFATGTDKLTRGSSQVLDKAVAVLKEFPTLRVQIQCHTDNSGDAEKNRDLSRRRAEAVKTYLAIKGIAADRLEAVGFGPDQPVADNGTPEGRTKNRRVEFHVH